MTYIKNKKSDAALIRSLGLKWALPSITLILLSSCVNVAAPDQPIVINLNIKIDQEVTLKAAEAVEEAIEDNAGIF